MMLTADLYLSKMLRMSSHHEQEQLRHFAFQERLWHFAFRDTAVKRFCLSCVCSFRAGNANGRGSEKFVGY